LKSWHFLAAAVLLIALDWYVRRELDRAFGP